ncbi:MAG: TIGR03564 family F420-dependent LLM class oxidoreductase [Actinomycetota bacterium]
MAHLRSSNNPLGVPLGWAAGTAINGIDDLRAEARYAATAGFDALWVSQIFGVDPVVALAAVAADVEPLAEVGTSVVPIYGRHPLVLAAMARTAQSALDGRFTLGVGPSHAMVVEGFFGESYARPFTHTAEFIEALVPLLRGEPCDVDGDEVTAKGWLTVESEPVPVLLAALGPRMLDLAGRRCAGTSLGPGMSPQVIAEHVAPRIRTAAAAAGRSAPRIKALVSVALTDDPAGLVAEQRESSRLYAGLPAYRRVLDLAGLDSPADVVIAGTMDDIAAGMASYVEAGATELRVGVVPSVADATKTALADWIQQ